MTHTAHCLTCDWTHDGPDADKQAEKHTKTTGHATSSATTNTKGAGK